VEICLKDYDAVTFDCYGTLIDWDTGIANFLGPWAVNSDFPDTVANLMATFAERQYENQRARPFKNYRQVLEDALAEAVDALGGRIDAEDLSAFSQAVANWPAFVDTVDALRHLKRHGLHLGILSNVDADLFELSHPFLGGLIDTAVTADMVQAYKPALVMFEALFAALDKKNIEQDRILHVAQSRFHDVAPGNRIGLNTVWIDRRHGRPGNGVTIHDDSTPFARFNNLEAFCAALND